MTKGPYLSSFCNPCEILKRETVMPHIVALFLVLKFSSLVVADELKPKVIENPGWICPAPSKPGPFIEPDLNDPDHPCPAGPPRTLPFEQDWEKLPHTLPYFPQFEKEFFFLKKKKIGSIFKPEKIQPCYPKIPIWNVDDLRGKWVVVPSPNGDKLKLLPNIQPKFKQQRLSRNEERADINRRGLRDPHVNDRIYACWIIC